MHNNKTCSKHLRDWTKAEPYFQVFPIYFEINTTLRKYKEEWCILGWNGYKINDHKRL